MLLTNKLANRVIGELEHEYGENAHITNSGKRFNNAMWSARRTEWDFGLRLLRGKGYEVDVLASGSRLAVHAEDGIYDFWPATGRFKHRLSGLWGIGIGRLIYLLKQGGY